MKSMFSTTGIRILESLAFTDTLYAFDFDGTLAPIVKDPASAKANKVTEELLSQLASLVPVAVVSGRSVADLKKRIQTPIRYLVGNHGLEGLAIKKESIELAKKTSAQWNHQLSQNWSKVSDSNGVIVEDKVYSLALHYRKSRNKKRAKSEIFELIQELKPAPRVIPGKCVMNLLPAGGPHKGVALLEMLMGLNLKCAFYIGDDDTDEDVFSLPDSRIISVRVGVKRNSQAQFTIQTQSEINRLLKSLIAIHKKTRTRLKTTGVRRKR